MARKCMGRQKIEMKKMSKESNLLVTFSKRRAGLLKKASELGILCGVEVAVIVFSPGKNKVFSFGCPNVEHITRKFLTNQHPNPTTNSGVLQPEGSRVAELSTHLTMLHDHMEIYMAYGEQLKDVEKHRQALEWWEAPVGELRLENLQMLKSGLAQLETSVATRRNNIAIMQQLQNVASSSLQGGDPTDGSGPSQGIMMTPRDYAFY